MEALAKLVSDRKMQPRPRAQEPPVKHKSVCLLPHATASFSIFFKHGLHSLQNSGDTSLSCITCFGTVGFILAFSLNFTLRKYKLKGAIAGI